MFTTDNTIGYTQQQIAALNAELAALLAGTEPNSDEAAQIEKAFSDEVASR
jgi:hypothetical protein